MATIFISFCEADSEWANWIGWVLENEGGHKVRKYDWEIKSGIFLDWMDKTLRECDAVLGVVSENYMKDKKYSEMEQHYAAHRKASGTAMELRYVVVDPCVIDGLARIYVRRTLHGLDLDAAKKELLDYFEPATRPTSEPAFPGKPRKVGAAVGATTPPFPPTLAAAPTSAPSASVFDTDHLPDLNYVELRGREVELALLDDAWADAGVNIQSLVAWGGAGKTAVVTEWLRRRREARDAEVVLGWSFYSQGSHQRNASADGFLVWAAERLGLDTAKKSPNDLAEAIGEALGHRRILLVLDGLEPLQEGLGPQMGYLRDPALRTLLRRAANLPRRASAGLVLVTTRVEVADLAVARFKDMVKSHPLDRLSDSAGAALLTDRGVDGRQTDLEAAAHEFAGHALALTLLAGFLVRRHGGEVAKRDHVRTTVTEARTRDEMVHGHAKRVMESLDAEWLATAPLARAILFAVGLFDRPASADCLKALREEQVSSGLAAFTEADDDEIAETIHDLRKVGLLAEEDPGAPGSLDAHPLVREWFGERFHTVDADGWRSAHGRLFDHLCAITHEDSVFPTLDQLQPLFQAIPHGCRAGQHWEALHKVYVSRICRRHTNGNVIFYAQDKLGAVSASLAALAWFFSQPFDRPHPDLTLADQNWVLGEATYYLGQLGRFTEALPGLRVAEDTGVKRGSWTNAATYANNLASAEVVVGNFAAAAITADRGINWSERADDYYWMTILQARAADIAAARGDRDTARNFFDQAMAYQQKAAPDERVLHSVSGWQFATFLLETGDFGEAIDFTTSTFAISLRHNWLIPIGLDHSSLARGNLGRLLTGGGPTGSAPRDALADALEHAVAALDTFRRANSLAELPQGHFALARIARACGDWAGATRELDEIEDFARPSGMKPTLCDLALERCRLVLARIEAHAPLADHVSWAIPAAAVAAEADLRAVAEAALVEACGIVASCGYHRRDAEVAELADVLAGRRRFADLPPRV